MRRLSALVSLDEHDRLILKSLELNGRRQNQEVAASSGLSPSACLQRIRRLEQAHIIRRYITEIDLTYVDAWLQLSVSVVITAEARKQRQQFESRLRASKHIVSADQVVGRFDYVLRIIGPDASIWPAVLHQIDPDGYFVAKADTHICVRTAKFFFGHPQLSTD